MAGTRWRVGIWVGLIALAILGGLAYRVYIVGPSAAIRIAEAFGFRRLTVAQLADQETFRFHFVTNRATNPDGDGIDNQFQQARGSELTFGAFDTHIEPTLGLGMLIDATDWFQNQQIKIDQVTELERGAFTEQLREFVEKSPFRSLLVVVHGFREAFPSALRKTTFLAHVLDINSPVLVFDWPGDQGSSLRGYRRARGVARDSGQELAETLRLLIDEVQPERLWLIANSMGGQVVADAFGILYQSADLADAEPEIEDVILTAPDIDKAEFDEQFKQEISALADHLTVYVSSNDRALLVSRIINRGLRGGESTLDPDGLQDALRLAELVVPDSDHVTLVDVTPVNRTRNFHNFSLETPEFFDDLYLRMTNSTDPNTRLIYKVKTPEGKVYQVLTPGR